MEETKDIVIAIKQLNIDKLEKLHSEISNPFSDSYRRYLTRADVAAITCNSNALDKVIDYISGIRYATVIKTSKFGEYISVRAPKFVWEEILVTKLESFKTNERMLHAKFENILEHSIPTEVAEHISGIFVHSEPLSTVSKNEGTTRAYEGARDAFQDVLKSEPPIFTSPAKINKFYRIPSNQGNKLASQSVFETIEQYFSPSDLRKFQLTLGLPVQSVRGLVGPSRANDSACINNFSSCEEANLDIQYITAIAQNVTTTYWYVDPSVNPFVDWILAVAEQEHPPLVHSISFSAYEDALPIDVLNAFNVEAMKLGLLGVTIVAASGDDGVTGSLLRESGGDVCGYFPQFPASSPYVLSVGGTMGLESEGPEVACEGRKGGIITSGGGFSNTFAQPVWQRQVVSSYFSSLPGDSQPFFGYSLKYSRKGRGYPDIAMAAHNYIAVMGGKFFLVSGTSASAPVMAGMLSLINSKLLSMGRPPVGFVNPTLYADNGAFANDVTVGTNDCSGIDSSTKLVHCCARGGRRVGFTAAVGWDPVTGFGSADFPRLSNVLTDLTAQGPDKWSRNDRVEDLNYFSRWSFSTIIYMAEVCVVVVMMTMLVLAWNRKRICHGYTPIVELHSANSREVCSENKTSGTLETCSLGSHSIGGGIDSEAVGVMGRMQYSTEDLFSVSVVHAQI